MKLIAKQSEKLIKFLIHNIQGMSFSSAQKAIRTGKIKVNNKKIKDNITIEIGYEIEILEFKVQKPNIDIIYIDDNVVIVNKPAGIECATRDKSSENTYSLEEILNQYNAIVVHRLDRLTEGLVILARNKDIARKFEGYFKENMIHKYYKALTQGKTLKSGIYEAYLYKDSRKSIMTVSNTKNDGFKQILTEIISSQKIQEFNLLDIKLHTGRTHQIRSHLSFLNNGIIGDSKYNSKSYNFNYKGYFLTAYKLEFELKDELSYLNKLNFQIQPTWLKLLKQEKNS